MDSEAQPLFQDPDVLVENDDTLNLDLPDMPTSDLEAHSIKWLLETSTDPEVFIAAASIVLQIEWPLDLDVSDMLHQLFDIFMSCADTQGCTVPSLEEKASACTTTLSHLYYGRVLQAYPDRRKFIIRRTEDLVVFVEIYVHIADRGVLNTTLNLCRHGDIIRASLPEACPESVCERLSHLLPYHFITERVSKYIENLTIAVISKLLSSPSSPSDQILANCILLACVMVGGQVDKKDIVRIDKSSALPLLSNSLLAQFQKALWVWDGGELDNDSTGVARRAWKLLDIIWRILEASSHYLGSTYSMWNLDVCRKIFSRARSSDASVSLAAP
ncbi:hypothetical protein EV424DRAFT_1626782 [Suillus variegatus]|nr:hypothetical protein EV424DRAFT_1626782 [Suillus variegatus]